MRTVASTPTTTTTRFALCWAVRTAFSPGERSDQRTWPVSPVSVMDLRGGGGGGGGRGGEVEGPAKVGRVVERAARRVRGRRRRGRSSEMASEGR